MARPHALHEYSISPGEGKRFHGARTRGEERTRSRAPPHSNAPHRTHALLYAMVQCFSLSRSSALDEFCTRFFAFQCPVASRNLLDASFGRGAGELPAPVVRQSRTRRALSGWTLK
jgi:hypothetical protein